MIWDPRFWQEEERLWEMLLATDPLLAEKIDRCTDTGCWKWCGATVKRKRSGYTGRVRRPLGVPNSESKAQLTHRYLRALLIEEFPQEYEIHHWCQRSICCMPLHCSPHPIEEHLELEAELREEGYIYTPPPRIRVYADIDSELPF